MNWEAVIVTSLTMALLSSPAVIWMVYQVMKDKKAESKKEKV